MRVAALGFSLESNTFSKVQATFDRFTTGGLLFGAEVTQIHRAGHSSMSGLIAASERAGVVELVPLFYSFPSPMGAMTVDAFEALWGPADRMLRTHGPFEDVLLAQHGAAVSDGYPDASPYVPVEGGAHGPCVIARRSVLKETGGRRNLASGHVASTARLHELRGGSWLFADRQCGRP